MSIDNVRHAQEALARYYKLKGAGVCIQCGKPKTVSTTRCPQCIAKYKVWHKSRYELWKSLHKCVMCGKEMDSEDKHVKCESCREWQKYYNDKAKYNKTGVEA